MAASVAGVGDLTIRVVSRRLVKASHPPSVQSHVAPFSNLDLYACNVQMFMLCLYPPKIPNAGGSGFGAVVATFEALLPSLLSHFYPVVGRIATNPSSGLPVLLWQNQGADLVVGESDVALRSLDYSVAQLSVKKLTLPFPQDIILSIQLLSFACGGFTVVWAFNHLLVDGHTITALINAWSQLAQTGKIAGKAISRDTSAFCPRSQPSYSDSLAATFTTYDEHSLPNALTADASFVNRLYYIEMGDVAALRDKASTGSQRSTRVEAVSAYLWKELAAAICSTPSEEARCRMGWWVSARHRVRAPNLVAAMRRKNYLGNATLYAPGDAAVEEILRMPLPEVAAMVRDAITSPDYDKYIQEMVDWVEVHKTEGELMEAAVVGLGAPTMNLSVMGTFPLDTDFGFGQATLAMNVPDFGRLCSAYLWVGNRPAGGDGSWLVSAHIWPQLAAALEADGIFKPVTAEYLGLTGPNNRARL